MTLRTHLDGTVFTEELDGRPPAVLALHGWGRDRSDLLASLDGRSVVSVDLPGFGASPPPAERCGAREYAELVQRLIDELGGGPFVVVGHSFGGRVATCLAAAHPASVAGLVLMGTPLARRTPSTKSASPLGYRLVRTARRFGLIPESRLEAARQKHGSADYRAAQGVMRDVLVTVVNEDYRDELARVACPVALLWGHDDTAAPLHNVEAARELLASIVFDEVLPGVGHDVHRAAPDAVGRAVDAVVEATR